MGERNKPRDRRSVTCWRVLFQPSSSEFSGTFASPDSGFGQFFVTGFKSLEGKRLRNAQVTVAENSWCAISRTSHWAKLAVRRAVDGNLTEVVGFARIPGV